MSRAKTSPRLNRHGEPIIRTRRATPQQRFLTVQQISHETGWPPRSVYQLITLHGLPFLQFPGDRRMWIARTDLNTLIERCTQHRGIA